jgi:hypothetical protein
MVPRASGYIWSLSDTAHARIVSHAGSGNADTVVVVHFDSLFTSVLISVKATRECGTSAAKTMSIVKSIPATPTITGLVSPCPGTVQTYSAYSATGTNYLWTVPSTATFTGQGTPNITVNFKSTFIGGFIAVKANSVCGTSASKSLTIVKCPNTPVPAGKEGIPVGKLNDVTAGLIHVFPNPANGDFYIQFSSGQENSTVKVEMVNEIGQVVLQNKGQIVGGKVSVKVENKLKSGAYKINCYVNGVKLSGMLIFID